jgi:hypothetical protein
MDYLYLVIVGRKGPQATLVHQRELYYYHDGLKEHDMLAHIMTEDMRHDCKSRNSTVDRFVAALAS